MTGYIKKFYHNHADPKANAKKAVLPRKFVRGRWIFVNGEMIPAHEYHARQGATSAPQIMSDIEPYKSMHDGSRIGGRRQHREHLRQHGLIEYGNEKPKPLGDVPLPPAAPDIKQAMEMVQAGHRPGRTDTFNPREFE